MTGGSSYVLSLPKGWIRERNIQKNDPLGVVSQADGTLLITPNLHYDSTARTKEFGLKDYPDPTTLLRSLIGAYISGFTTIKITSAGRIPPKVRMAVRKFTQMTIGQEVSEETGTRIYPIIGVGSAPFRGGLSPGTVDRVTAEYPSVHTFTVQSAFKYDHPLEVVQNAVRKLEERRPGRARPIDEKAALDLMVRYTRAYERRLGPLAPLINRVARYIPERRKRKLHIGLFGYARSTGGITLPRAIKFTAALYSVGLPPELLGLDALDEADIGFVRETYVNFDEDLKTAARFLNTETGFVPRELASRVADLVDVEPDEEHAEITGEIARVLRDNDTGRLTSLILSAAHRRKFLG